MEDRLGGVVEVRQTPLYRSFEDLRGEVAKLAERHGECGHTSVYGIPRGGVPVGLMVAEAIGLEVVESHETTYSTLVVDDLVDSGATAKRWTGKHGCFDALYRKGISPPQYAPEATEHNAWLVFPWETNDDSNGPEDAVRRILQHIGEDPNRDGLVNTPGRVVRAMRELTVGYEQTAEDVLTTTFDVNCDEMVVMSGIEFSSMCEHHMLPFYGHATVGYVPDGPIVGLSKLARLVEVYARRLQVQERMTEQISDAMSRILKPKGAGVIITAAHSCMGVRGVKKPTALTTTASVVGLIKSDPMARAEFLSHHHHQ